MAAVQLIKAMFIRLNQTAKTHHEILLVDRIYACEAVNSYARGMPLDIGKRN